MLQNLDTDFRFKGVQSLERFENLLHKLCILFLIGFPSYDVSERRFLEKLMALSDIDGSQVMRNASDVPKVEV